MISMGADARAQVRENLRDPVRWTEVLQLVKTVVAAVLAWVLASQVFDLPQAFLAPWAALLVVHATVYRTFSRGLRQVAGAVLGVLLAWAVGNYLGLTTFAVSTLLVVGLLAGSVRWFRDESTAVAATGLIVLTTGFSTHDQVLRRAAVRHLDRHRGRARGQHGRVAPAARLLLRQGHRRRRRHGRGAVARHGPPAAGHPVHRGGRPQLGAPHPDARRRHRPRLGAAASGQGERSAQPAPRGAVGEEDRRLRGHPRAATSRRSQSCAAWPARSGTASSGVIEWEPAFADRWVALLAEAGEAIGVPGLRTRRPRCATDLSRLAEELSTEQLSGLHWPEYGALIMNLRNIVASMDRVAEQNPVVLPRYARRDRCCARRCPAGIPSGDDELVLGQRHDARRR